MAVHHELPRAAELGDPTQGEGGGYLLQRRGCVKADWHLLMERDEAWATGHRYLDMVEYLAWMDKPKEAEVIHQRRNELEVA